MKRKELFEITAIHFTGEEDVLIVPPRPIMASCKESAERKTVAHVLQVDDKIDLDDVTIIARPFS